MPRTDFQGAGTPTVNQGNTFTMDKFPSKPSPLTGGWLPGNRGDCLESIGKLIVHVNNGCRDNEAASSARQPAGYKHQSVKELHALIEESAELSILFRSMFEEIPFTHRFDVVGKPYDIVDYEQLLAMFDMLLERPPMYNENLIVALPFTLLLEWPMATRAGIAAFLNEKLNRKLGAVLDEWGRYLADPSRDSKLVVMNGSNPGSWLSYEARKFMQNSDPQNRTFEELYECDPSDQIHLGFRTWDDFFTRKFADGVRPVEDTSDDTVSNGCESSPYAIKQKVKETEKFWLKGQPYSLKHMLKSEEDAKKFAGGTVYQAFLSPLTYHRWHSPINGTVTKLVLVKGSYFSVSPVHAFPDPETFANTQSQAYITSVASRALIHFNNSTVGDMVMMAVGMVEVSTCELNSGILSKMDCQPSDDPSVTIWKPKPNQKVTVRKGDEVGMFHFGGSTHCLVFGPKVMVKFWQCALPQDSDHNDIVPLNATIADVMPYPGRS